MDAGILSIVTFHAKRLSVISVACPGDMAGGNGKSSCYSRSNGSQHNTDGWERRNEEGEHDEDLFVAFRVPLSHAGVNCSFSDLLDEWHSLIQYTIRYLDPAKSPYRRV